MIGGAKRWQRGSSMVETVIVMSVLLALMFGIIDFGRALYTYSFVAQEARQGARWLIVRGAHCTVLDHCDASYSGSTNDLQTYVRSLSVGATNPNRITAWGSTSTLCNAHTMGCAVTVTVTYPFSFMLPFVPAATINMSSTSTMVVAN
jgi:Flp pilus assembly protein TadG